MLNVDQVTQLVNQADGILQDRNKSTQDCQHALKIYRLAGKMGSGIAYKKIGDLYKFGEHIQIDLARALLNYEKSVNLGYLLALSDIAIVYILLKDYQNIIYSWERYFTSVDIENIQDAYLPSKALFYLLIKIRNNDLFNIYKCFYRYIDDILNQIDEDSNKITKSIFSNLKYLKTLQIENNNQEIETIQLKLAEEMRDLKDLKKCSTVLAQVCSQRSNFEKLHAQRSRENP